MLHRVCLVSPVWQEPPALGRLQRPHRGRAHPAQSRLRPGHPRRREFTRPLRPPRFHFRLSPRCPGRPSPVDCLSSFSFQFCSHWRFILVDVTGLMTSSGLEWDPLDCPLVGFPFPAHSEKRGQIDSVWSMSSATGCSTPPRTGGSRRCRLSQEEERSQRRRRRAGKEPGGSGRVKEVSQHRCH